MRPRCLRLGRKAHVCHIRLRQELPLAVGTSLCSEPCSQLARHIVQRARVGLSPSVAGMGLPLVICVAGRDARMPPLGAEAMESR